MAKLIIILCIVLAVLCLVGTASGTVHTLTEAMGDTITMSSFTPTLVAGDTVVISSNRTSAFKLYNIVGSAGSWITFTNPSDANVTITDDSPIEVDLCRYIHILGNNYSSKTYGIRLTASVTGGMNIVNTRDIEVAYIEIDNITGVGIGYGQCWAPWTCEEEMENVTLHHIYIHEVSNEGMYLGKSSVSVAPKFKDIQIYNVIVENSGWDGIQLGQTTGDNNNIYNCTLNNTGHGGEYIYCWSTDQYQTDPCPGQWFGIVINPEHSGISVYQCSIRDPYYTGISSSSVGTALNIHDNWMCNGTYNGINIAPASGVSTVISNTIVNFSNYGISTSSGDTTGELLYNLIIGSGVNGINSAYSNQTDNRVQASIVGEYFVDADEGNYRLTTSSPAKDAGTGGNYSTVDFDGVSRPQGTAADIGAFEYVSTSLPNITSWENNDTSDSTLDITVDLDQNVKFNGTANQTTTTWDWEVDSVDQSNNYDNLTLDWSIPGEYIVTVTAANTNGTSSEIQWNVTVDDSTTWGDSNYSYRKYIIFDDDLIYGTNTNFSVLINTTDTDLANNTQPDGGDIKFMIGSTQMPHDLVEYNHTSGYIRAWVRMSELSDTNRLLHIYYGNATVENQWNATTTWQDYNLTFHMEGDPSAGVLDSSGNLNGTATGLTSVDEITGKIGNATNFDGTNDYIQITGLLGEPANVTISMWINQTGTDTSGSSEVISLGDCLAIRLQPNWKAFYHHASGYNPIDTTDNLLDDGWTYIAVTMQQDDQRILKNTGTELTTETNAQVIDYTTKGTNTRVGSHGNGEVIYDFVGDMDEVRVTSLIRNADWIHTEYQNQDDPAGFATYGDEESNEPDTHQNVSGVWYFWTYENIPELHTAINDETVLEYNTTLDIYKFHESFYQNVSTDTFYYNETTHLKSNNDGSPTYFRWAGKVEFDNAAALSWNTTANTTAPKTDATRAYIYCDDYATGNITNMNMSFLGYDSVNKYGITLSDFSNMTIENNTFDNNYYGIFINGGSENNTFNNNTMTDSDESGIYITGNNNEIINNSITNNEGNGIMSMGGHYCNISNNTIYSNLGTGIYLFGTNNNDINNNTIYSNSHSGIYLYASDDNELKHNNVSDTSGSYYDFVISIGSDNTEITNSTKVSDYYKFDVSSSPVTFNNGVDYNISVTEETVMQDNLPQGTENVNVTVVSGTIDWINVSGLSASTDYSTYYSINDTAIESKTTDGTGVVNFTTNLGIESYYINETTWTSNTSILYLGINSQWIDNSTWIHLDTPTSESVEIPPASVDFWGSY